MIGACPVAARSGEDGAAALVDLVNRSGCRTLAIIGLVKNAGKTTALNAMLGAPGHTFGITSLGLDGESIDHLTGLPKPRIAPPRGTLVATTRGSLERSRAALEEIEELAFRTPLGNVVIGRTAGDGIVEVSGPTMLAELSATAARLHELGADLVLVDGAINRVGSASPRVSDGVILATGGMAGDTLDEVLETTTATLDMLALPGAPRDTLAMIGPHAAGAARAVAFARDGRATALEMATAVGEGVAVARAVDRLGAGVLYVAGALTEEFLGGLTRALPPRHRLSIVVRDATVLVMPAGVVARAHRRGIALEVLTPIRVLALTVNPFRLPQPYEARAFFHALADAVGERIPVFDVVHGLSREPARPDPAVPPVPDGTR